MNAYEQVIAGSGEVFMSGKRVGTLESVTVDFSQENKAFQGESVWDQTSLTTKKSIKISAAQKTFDGELLAALLDITPTTGSTVVHTEAFAAGASHTVANSATYVDTLEVRDSTGKRMSKVASAPTAGQYSVAAGVYTFNAAEGAVTIQYQATKVTGKTVSGANAAIGKTKTVKVVLHNAFMDADRPVGIVLYSVAPSSMGSISWKLNDFSDPGKFEGNAMADLTTGKVFDLFYEVP